MKFILLPHLPDLRRSHGDQLAELVELGVLAEELGFDGYGIGERHDLPATSSSPAVILTDVAARTQTLRLFTAVATIGFHDPVRVYEDYATLDHLSGGRLELLIGRGGYPRSLALFGVDPDERSERFEESHALLRRLWSEDDVTWEGRFRPPLEHAEALPRPRTATPRIWHASSSSKDSMELAARYGDPVFSSNAVPPLERYSSLVDHYRERLVHHGHDPSRALVGVGVGGFFAARTSQEAVAQYRKVFDARIAINRQYDASSIKVDALEEWIEQGSALVGSPQQIIEKVHRQHEAFGHELFHIHVDREVLGTRAFDDTLELFFSEIAPVLRRELPSRPLTSAEAEPSTA